MFIRRFLILAVLLTAPILFTPAAFAQSREARGNLGAYAELLTKYVVQGKDGINRVRYGAWKQNRRDRSRLNETVQALQSRKPSAMEWEDAFAYWVNLYNALTLKLIVDDYPVASIKDIESVGRSLLDLVSFGGPWRTKRATVEGRELSLDDIEHEILRPKFRDPRVHYAVNCASIGCPNIKPEPWSAQTLDADLNEAARAYINHPRGVNVDGENMTVSSIYRWYRVDFGNSDQGILDHLRKYADEKLQVKLRNVKAISGDNYDWSLNDAK